MRFNLKIIGTGRDEKYLRSIAGPTVEFLGNLPDNQFEKIFSSAKAFLFASRDEEFGIACLEAMGYGLPVIAYNSGGVPEYVKDKINGFLFNELNPLSLVEKIKEFEKLDKKQFLKMKKQARITAENFTQKNFKKNLLLFLKNKINYARITRS